ncbi:GNAT family N-acetyltransferase [Actinoplanes sp. ATCC 53533]|uniref:GNAT family N-acetyltransferase n=1 Tax=Actinoplanes sp. ATCC 53533 TaxID=1288362 RepID=UPI000F77E1AE|nr:GNAT family N-acetyltransferase [Actinoplanes sp. ATCC 53533]RSM54093.1 GNAT family N-acetyltransferase [Actinoplanes sp. ATCC 53533]
MEIRAATPQDWPRIYPFWSRIVEAGETYAYPLGLSADEARALWMEEPPGLTVVAVDGGEIVGSAKMGPNRPGRGAHVATGSFMVDPGRQGRGVGRALGEYVVAWSRDNGYHSIQFNAVVQVNDAAVRLWQALGFVIVGTVPEAFDHQSKGRVGLHIMVKKL